MIQTQLLKADPPYQIISAAGRIGIQVATLIVTENKSTKNGYAIDTHSHPVVNYGLKSLAEKGLKEAQNKGAEAQCYLQPEGAVWNKVEISDVTVLGLVGITQNISLGDFCSIVRPSKIGIGKPIAPVWDYDSMFSIYELRHDLLHTGIHPEPLPFDAFDRDEQGRIVVYLSENFPANVPPLIDVQLTRFEYDEMNNNLFSFLLYNDDNSLDDCANIIASTVTQLRNMFMPSSKIVFKGVTVLQDVERVVDLANNYPLL
ncbi:MAG: hypothetical protein K6A96_09295 [Prevotella sp.]|nr:hypothetical protein [Prevotella sp.]